jgi:hypothetical protein
MPVGLAAQQFIIHANGDSIKGDIEGFTYWDLENDLETGLLVYPSITESGRVRIDFDVSYR